MQINLIDRVKAILMTPNAEWPTIASETTSIADLYRNYIMILAAIPVVAHFIGAFVFGYSVGSLGTIHEGFFSGIATAIVHYVFTLVLIYGVSLLVSYLAANFGGVKDDLQALKLVAYSYTPAWIAGVFGLVPGLHILSLLGLYSLYVFFVGAPTLMRIPTDKAVVFTAVVVVVTVVLSLIFGVVVGAVFIGSGLGVM